MNASPHSRCGTTRTGTRLCGGELDALCRRGFDCRPVRGVGLAPISTIGRTTRYCRPDLAVVIGFTAGTLFSLTTGFRWRWQVRPRPRAYRLSWRPRPRARPGENETFCNPFQRLSRPAEASHDVADGLPLRGRSGRVRYTAFRANLTPRCRASLGSQLRCHQATRPGSSVRGSSPASDAGRGNPTKPPSATTSMTWASAMIRRHSL